MADSSSYERHAPLDPQRVGTFALICLLVIPGFASAYRRGEPDGFSKRLSEAALERTDHEVVYDGTYRSIEYPNGDVPDGIGVCTDVVVRAYRRLGIDLQKAVHEEMTAHFDAYPKNWNLSRPDSNIDHRRVPNLRSFFSRKGILLPTTRDSKDYVAGDLVTWMLPKNTPHIGIVVGRKSPDGIRPLVVHNIGRGPSLDDMLFDYPITGHYRYYGTP